MNDSKPCFLFYFILASAKNIFFHNWILQSNRQRQNLDPWGPGSRVLPIRHLIGRTPWGDQQLKTEVNSTTTKKAAWRRQRRCGKFVMGTTHMHGFAAHPTKAAPFERKTSRLSNGIRFIAKKHKCKKKKSREHIFLLFPLNFSPRQISVSEMILTILFNIVFLLQL